MYRALERGGATVGVGGALRCPTLTETCPPFVPPTLLVTSNNTTMTAVVVAFQRATFDLTEMPTTPGRPRDVQVVPQPLMAPGSPVTPRTGGMLPFVSAV